MRFTGQTASWHSPRSGSARAEQEAVLLSELYRKVAEYAGQHGESGSA